MPILKKRIRPLLDAIDAYVLIIRRDNIVLVNHAFQTWFGLPQEGMEGDKLFRFVLPASRRRLIGIYLELLRQASSSFTFESLILHPLLGAIMTTITIKRDPYFEQDDHWIVTISPHHSTEGTHHFANDAWIQQSDVDQNIEAYYPNVSPATHGNYLIDNALERFLATLHTIVPYSSASIALLNHGAYNFIAMQGFPEGVNLAALNEIANTQFDTMRSDDSRHNQPIQIINDVRLVPDWVSIDELNIRSWMRIRLEYDGDDLGDLYLDSQIPNFFNEKHARHAIALSQQAILAIIYTRLYNRVYDDFQERQRLQQILVKNLINTETMYASQALLFSSDQLAQCLPDLLKIVASSFENTQIVLVCFMDTPDEGFSVLKLSSEPMDIWSAYGQIAGEQTLPVDHPPSQEITLPPDGVVAMAHGQHALAAGIHQYGILAAIRQESATPFTEPDHELITTIATQIAIALQTEMLYAQLYRHSLQLEGLVAQRTSQLEMEQQRLQAILDSTAEGIFYMEDFHIQYANAAFCRMVGYSAEELFEQPLDLIRRQQEISESHNFNILLATPSETEPGRTETRLCHKDGSEFHASLRFSLVGNPGENKVRMVAIARDISQERKLYLQRARFIANAAHELRNPISSLVLRLHMLKRQPERLDDHLHNLNSVTDYLRELVEELLTLSRFERGNITLDKKSVILQEIIQAAVAEHRVFAEEQEVTVFLDLPEDQTMASLDRQRATQMMSNLVVNAINYSHRAGSVYVSYQVEVDSLGNRNAVIKVRDEGIGIEPDLLPYDIFEPFSRPSQGSRKETGMGLAAVREIVHLHGGVISAQSKLNEGATFRVILPIN